MVSFTARNKLGCIEDCEVSTGTALASVIQWLECRPAHQEVAGLIPSQGQVPGL